MASVSEKQNLLGLDVDALTALMAKLGGKPFHARQLLKWMHSRGVSDIDAMTDLSKKLRDKLKQQFVISPPEVVERFISKDGTRKWLLEAGNGQAIEMVYIPEAKRGTLCISSQVGCALDCSFCSTGAQGFNRNLNTGEIVSQVWLANHELGAYGEDGLVAVDGDDDTDDAEDDSNDELSTRVTNVVFMGMGEPLANYKQVLPALNILTNDHAYMLSRRRVTVSTSGLVPQLKKLGEESNVALAVSLHAPTDDLRDQLVPINRKHPINELLDQCWDYLSETSGRSVTFEYTLIDGVNDKPAQATKLAALLKGRPAKVNLIPFNPFPGNDFKRSKSKAIRTFRDILHKQDIRATVRKTRGDDIDAACGQLAGQVSDRVKVRLGSKQFTVVTA
ncbi:MAG: 23S rRNA (adenine(2503)-C(2))-methyltransferase RlmN [Gammaproteobacteria bacterium]